MCILSRVAEPGPEVVNMLSVASRYLPSSAAVVAYPFSVYWLLLYEALVLWP